MKDTVQAFAVLRALKYLTPAVLGALGMLLLTLWPDGYNAICGR